MKLNSHVNFKIHWKPCLVASLHRWDDECQPGTRVFLVVVPGSCLLYTMLFLDNGCGEGSKHWFRLDMGKSTGEDGRDEMFKCFTTNYFLVRCNLVQSYLKVNPTESNFALYWHNCIQKTAWVTTHRIKAHLSWAWCQYGNVHMHFSAAE